MNSISQQTDDLRSVIYSIAEESLAKVTSDPEDFIETGLIKQVKLPINVPVEICEGFFATCLVKNSDADFDVIQVDYRKGFSLPKNKHSQLEAIVNIQGILATRIWDVNGEEKRIILSDDKKLESFNINSNSEHDHEAIQSGVFVSVMSPRITSDEPISWCKSLINWFSNE